MAVEGKVSESFGPTLGEWQDSSSEGRKERWGFLCATLAVSPDQAPDLRYQLFHRTASAVLAADRFHATHAVLLVHSFTDRRTGWPDFVSFLRIFGRTPTPNSLEKLCVLGQVSLYAGWAEGDRRFTTA
jgi:hypothetical protein